MDASMPRAVTSVLVEEGDGVVTITWGLGEPVGPASYFSYLVTYYGTDGNGGKQFGVKVVEKTIAFVFDHTSSTQSNYDADAVTVRGDSMIATFRDADIGLHEVGTILGVATVDGRDTQTDLPVTLLR
jgi:hypothetical protein